MIQMIKYYELICLKIKHLAADVGVVLATFSRLSRRNDVSGFHLFRSARPDCHRQASRRLRRVRVGGESLPDVHRRRTAGASYATHDAPVHLSAASFSQPQHATHVCRRWRVPARISHAPTTDFRRAVSPALTRWRCQLTHSYTATELTGRTRVQRNDVTSSVAHTASGSARLPSGAATGAGMLERSGAHALYGALDEWRPADGSTAGGTPLTVPQQTQQLKAGTKRNE